MIDRALTFLMTGLILAPGTLRAETIRFDLPVPAARSFVDDLGYTHIEIEGFAISGQPGAPALPSRTVLLALPYGHEAGVVVTDGKDERPIPGLHRVFPIQRRLPHSARGPAPFTAPRDDLYRGQTAYGQALPVQYKRGFSVLPIKVTPAVYDAKNGTLAVAHNVSITVSTQPAAKSELFRGRDRDFAAVAGLVENPGALRDLYPSSQRPAPSAEYRYLVITGGGLDTCDGAHTLSTLLADKQDRGLTTLLTTVAELVATSDGLDPPEKIRNFIREMYSAHDTDFVLLAGDADLEEIGGETEAPIVPVRGLWGDIEYGGAELNLPSDLYYAALDGDFNADLDTVFGEATDEPDLFAEVLVGRAPVDSCEEIDHFVRKTLEYQDRVDTDLRNVWLVGEWLAPYTFGKDMLEEIHYGSWSGNTRGFAESDFFTVDTLYDADLGGADGWGIPEILDVLNGGVHVLAHIGHSYTNYNMRLTIDDLDAGLTNDLGFFDYTGGCYPGAFDNRTDPLGGNEVLAEDSFVEHLLLGEHGAFAAIMFTRYGIGNEVHPRFWDALFTHGLTNLAEMHNHSREASAALVDDPVVRWQIYSLTYFGDPEARLLTSDSAEPRLGVPQTGLWAVVPTGGDAPAAIVFTVRNDGGGVLDWSANSGHPWVTVTPDTGTAPTEVVVSMSTSGLAEGAYQGAITFTAPGAVNAPKYLPYDVYVVDIPSLEVPYGASSPVVDGTVEPGEYEGAGFIDVGFVAPGLTVARLLHDNDRLYVSLVVGDDDTPDPDDWLTIYIENNGDGHWPETPGEEGAYSFGADGLAYFIPAFNAGAGMQVGDYEIDPAGVEIAFGTTAGARVVELSFDFDASHLQLEPGDATRLALTYYDYAGGAYEMPAMWPAVLVHTDDSSLFGRVSLALEPEILVAAPEQLFFTGEAGMGPGDALSLSFIATTAADLDLTLTADAPWIRLAVTSATTPALVEIRADASELEPGSHQSRIVIAAPGAANTPVLVPVHFDVAEPRPVIAVDPAALELTVTAGLNVPTAAAVEVDNAGGGTLEWEAYLVGDWLTSSATEGTAPTSLEISVTDPPVEPGVYGGAILFVAAGAEPVQLPVRLTVEDPVTGGLGLGGGCWPPASGSCSSLPADDLVPLIAIALMALLILRWGRKTPAA